MNWDIWKGHIRLTEGEEKVMASPDPEDLFKHVKIVSAEEVETVDVVICAPLGPSPFNDNVTTGRHL
jgi:hypothetical protein